MMPIRLAAALIAASLTIGVTGCGSVAQTIVRDQPGAQRRSRALPWSASSARRVAGERHRRGERSAQRRQGREHRAVVPEDLGGQRFRLRTEPRDDQRTRGRWCRQLHRLGRRSGARRPRGGLRSQRRYLYPGCARSAGAATGFRPRTSHRRAPTPWFWGIPGGGPFVANPARIREVIELNGPDIYRTTTVTREVYTIRGEVGQGDSGGPLIRPRRPGTRHEFRGGGRRSGNGLRAHAKSGLPACRRFRCVGAGPDRRMRHLTAQRPGIGRTNTDS